MQLPCSGTSASEAAELPAGVQRRPRCLAAGAHVRAAWGALPAPAEAGAWRSRRRVGSGRAASRRCGGLPWVAAIAAASRSFWRALNVARSA